MTKSIKRSEDISGKKQEILSRVRGLIEKGRADQALDLLLPLSTDSLEMSIHAGITALHAQEWQKATELLEKPLERYAEIDQMSSELERIPARCSLSLLVARAKLGALSMEELLDPKGRETIRQLLDHAREEPLLIPMADLLGFFIYLSDGRMSPTMLKSLGALEKPLRLSKGDSRQREALALWNLCGNIIVKRYHFLKQLVRFINNRERFDKEVRDRRGRIGPTALGWRFWWPSLFRGLLGASVFTMLPSERCYLSALKSSTLRSQKIYVPEPDPDGKDWKTLFRISSAYALLRWRKNNISMETIFMVSIKPEETLAIYRMVRERKPRLALQVGNFIGFSAAVMALAMRDHCPGDALIHTVDAGFALG